MSFRVSADEARAVRREGNLDFVNFGDSVPADEPEAIFSASERGVIRTYR